MIGRAQAWQSHAVTIMFLFHPKVFDVWIDACLSHHDFLHMIVL